MASLCLDLFTSCWQEEAETEFTTKTLDLEALYGLQMHRMFRRAQQPMAPRAAAGNRRPIWRETGSAWASDFLFVEFLPGEGERKAWCPWCSEKLSLQKLKCGTFNHSRRTREDGDKEVLRQVSAHLEPCTLFSDPCDSHKL